MGSYTPPSSAAVPSKIQEFSFEQAANLEVTELSAASKKIKTIQIRGIPLTTAPEPIDVIVTFAAMSAILKAEAGKTLTVQFSSFTTGGVRLSAMNPGLSRTGATEGIGGSSDSSAQAQNDAPNADIDIVLEAFMSVAGTGIIKNFKAVIQMLIPEGATVTEV